MVQPDLGHADSSKGQSASPPPRTAGLRARFGHLEPRSLIGCAGGFAIVTYLALSNGGFDTIPRNQVGIIAWWIVLLFAAFGILPRRLGRPGWAAFALLAGFAVWTGLSIAWSESAELSADELGRVVTYAGVLLLALMTVRWAGGRPVLYGVASAVGLVGLLSVLSRLHPTWFSVDQGLVFLANSRRLSYPINYWNGLAAFLAMGVPLLLGVAATARPLAGRALSAAGVPILALGIFWTTSRGGAIALGIGLVAYLLLTDDRLAALATLAICAGGSAIVIAYADARPILQQGLRSAAAVHAGDAMLPIILVACAVVALLQTGVWLAATKLARPSWLRPPRRQGALRVGAVTVALLLAAAAVGIPGRLQHAWHDFKQPPGVVQGPAAGSLFTRLQSAAGNDRYQYWQLAAKVASAHPLEGTGAGTFVLVWARNANAPGHVQDAHSLYMQTLEETGYPGLLLIVAMILTFLTVGAWRAVRSRPKTRVLVASATAGVAAFSTSAIYDWVWQLAAVTVLAMLLGAASLATEHTESANVSEGGEAAMRGEAWADRVRRLLPRALLALTACSALVAVFLPLAEAQDLGRSQSEFSRGDYARALSDARSGVQVQPYAASALLQEALVLEKTGDYQGARSAAIKATQNERTNWQTWIILSRIESELGNGRAALADFARAHTMDPEGALF